MHEHPEPADGDQRGEQNELGYRNVDEESSFEESAGEQDAAERPGRDHSDA